MPWPYSPLLGGAAAVSGGGTTTLDVPLTSYAVSLPAPTTLKTSVSTVPLTSYAVSLPAPTTTKAIVSAVPLTSYAVSLPAPTTRRALLSSVPVTSYAYSLPAPTTTYVPVGTSTLDVPLTEYAVTLPEPATNVIRLDARQPGGWVRPIIYVDAQGRPVRKEDVRGAVAAVEIPAAQEARVERAVARLPETIPPEVLERFVAQLRRLGAEIAAEFKAALDRERDDDDAAAWLLLAG